MQYDDADEASAVPAGPTLEDLVPLTQMDTLRVLARIGAGDGRPYFDRPETAAVATYRNAILAGIDREQFAVSVNNFALLTLAGKRAVRKYDGCPWVEYVG